MTKPIGISSVARVSVSAAFVVLWASGFVGVRLAIEVAPAETMLMWRSWLLVAVLAPWIATALVRLSRADLGREALVGALSQAVYLGAIYVAIDLGVSSGTTSLMDGVQPLVVAGLAAPLLGSVLERRQWVALALGLAGVVVVSAADLLAPQSSAPWWAYPIPLVGMLGLVAATFVDRRRARRATALQALALHCLVTAVLATALAAGTGRLLPPWTGEFWFAMAWMAGLATLGGYGLYWLLLERRGVTQVNVLLFLVPPVATVWGAVWFDEPLGPATLAGLALALVAVRYARPSAQDDAGREQPVAEELRVTTPARA